MMTAQEIFDTVASHLLAQGCQSRSINGCAYRGVKGRKCAIGALIPDDQYDPLLDQTPMGITNIRPDPMVPDKWSVIEGNHASPGGHALACVMNACDIPSSEFELLVMLQGVHDTADVYTWRERLRGVAKNFGLEENF